MAKFWKEGLCFSCQQCGNCCTFQGGAVYASEAEFQSIADHLNISLDVFLLKYTEVIDTFISIKSIASGACIFYENGCTIYPHRPTQCRTYPFWPEILKNSSRWQKEANNCKGINSGKFHSMESIKHKLIDSDTNLFQKPTNGKN